MLLEAFLTSLFISTFCYPVLDCRHEPLGVSGTPLVEKREKAHPISLSDRDPINPKARDD